MDPNDPARVAEHDRRSAWKAAQAKCEGLWIPCLDDLNRFALEADDPAVRCGRHDVVAYILDSVIGREET